MKYTPLLILSLFYFTLKAQKNASVSFEKWLSLKQAGSPVISSDGKYIAYTVTSTDWASNGYDVEIWLSTDAQEPIQLTRTIKGSSGSAMFTPDNKFLSFLADRGDKTQLYMIPVNGGEAIQITKDEDGIGGYEWSPLGNQIAYTKAEPDSKKEKGLKVRYGAFAVEGEEFKLSHLWILNFNYDSIMLAGLYPCYSSKDSTAKNLDCYKVPTAQKLTKGNFTVAGFSWHPNGKSIIFNTQPNSLINSSQYSDIAIIDMESKKIEVLVANSANDAFIKWSPEGNAFIYISSVNDSITNFYKNNRTFIYDISSKKVGRLLQKLMKINQYMPGHPMEFILAQP